MGRTRSTAARRAPPSPNRALPRPLPAALGRGRAGWGHPDPRRTRIARGTKRARLSRDAEGRTSKCSRLHFDGTAAVHPHADNPAQRLGNLFGLRGTNAAKPLVWYTWRSVKSDRGATTPEKE